ncbi:hypothetical protein HG530_005367 [Fusarium avenaceum]|nr:hypothetical protein HG530_005367 [Fusarium avenaceum]
MPMVLSLKPLGEQVTLLLNTIGTTRYELAEPAALACTVGGSTATAAVVGINVGVNGQETSPGQGTERSPLLVHSARGAGKELVHEVENDAANDLSQNTGSNGKTLNNEVGDVKVGRSGDGGRQHGEDLAGVLHNSCDGRDETVGKCLNEEHLEDLEDEVGVLKGNRGQKTRDDTENDAGDISNPSKAWEGFDSVDLGDNTDNSHRNSPEDDENSNDKGDNVSANDNLPPRELEALPDNLIRLDTDVSRSHLKSMMVSGGLVGSLSIRLSVEFNENSRVLLVVTRKPVALGLVGFGDQSLELLTAPFNGVNLLANESKGASTVRRSLLAGNVAGGEVSSLRIGSGRLNLCLLELHRNFVAFLDDLVQVLGLTGDPNVLDRIVEESADAGLVKVVLGHRSEEDSTGRDTLGILGRQNLKLRFSIATGGIDWEENRPCDTETHKADGAANAKEADEEPTAHLPIFDSIQRTRDGLGLSPSRLALIALGRGGIGEVVLQPTDKVSHDGGPTVVA